MDKIKLDWFLKRGYKLAEGDVIYKGVRIKLHVNEAHILNNKNNTDGEINSFAWRNEQGAKPKCLNDDTFVLITFEGCDTASKKLAGDVGWSRCPLWQYDYNALLELQHSENKMASIGVQLECSEVGVNTGELADIANEIKQVIGEGADKVDMKELVKNAPDGATHWAPYENGMKEAYFNSDLSKAYVDNSWHSGLTEEEKHGAIKLDYSVLDKPVYTKAMREAGELPEVGMMINPTIRGLCEIEYIYDSRGETYYLYRSKKDIVYRDTMSSGWITPIDTRTGQEKMMDEASSIVDLECSNYNLSIDCSAAMKAVIVCMIKNGYKKA